MLTSRQEKLFWGLELGLDALLVRKCISCCQNNSAPFADIISNAIQPSEKHFGRSTKPGLSGQDNVYTLLIRVLGAGLASGAVLGQKRGRKRLQASRPGCKQFRFPNNKDPLRLTEKLTQHVC